MKLLIASDIHGSAKYCRELIGAFTREGADRLLLLGDILYHGPRNALPEGYAPMETAALLNAMRGRVFSVRGNCDADIDSVVLSFPTSADHAYLPAGWRLIFATHGHIYDKQTPPPLSSGDVLLCGHTHVPACDDMGGFIYMNPGSVSIPKEGSERGYMVFDGARFKWKTLDGREIMEYSLE